MASSPRTTMTKEQLRNALIQSGFTVPSISAKKEEFQRLYDEKVLPLQSQSEFSSDDEPEESGITDISHSSSSSPMKSEEKLSSVVGKYTESDLRKLNDEQLYQVCVEVLGSDRVGPIVGTTRNTYINIVLTKLNAGTANINNGQHSESQETNGNGTNGFSDSDDDEAVVKASRASRASRASTTPKRNTRLTPKVEQVPRGSSVQSNTEYQQGNRLNRRSEGPNSNLVEPTESQALEDFGLDGLGRRRENFLGCGDGVGVRADTISYFKERPGYASTTTSNVLPSKPIRKDHPKIQINDEEPAFNMRSLLYVAFFVLLVGLAYSFYAFQEQIFLTDGQENISELDELDRILETIDEQ